MPFGLLKLSLAETPPPIRFLTVSNSCSDTIWPAYAGSGSTGPGVTLVGGWEAPPRSSRNITLPDDWAGTFWGRQACDFSKDGSEFEETCLTGSCLNGLICGALGDTEFVTVVEVQLSAQAGSYNVHITSGFNLPIQIQSSAPPSNCAPNGCPTDFNPTCPPAFQAVTDNGTTLACKVNSTSLSWYQDGCPLAWVGEGPVMQGFCGSTRDNVTITFCPDGTTVAPSPPFASALTSGTMSTSGSSPSSASSSHAHRISKGSIAGIATGAVVGTLALFAVAFWILTRSRWHRKTDLPNKEPPTLSSYHIDPLIIDGRQERSRERPKGAEEKVDLPDDGDQYSMEGMPATLLNAEIVTSNNEGMVLTTMDSLRVDQSVPVHNSDVLGDTHVDRSAIDIQQLFEDREFENQLLNFLTQRMDPGQFPGSPQQSDHPPSYRPTPIP